MQPAPQAASDDGQLAPRVTVSDDGNVVLTPEAVTTLGDSFGTRDGAFVHLILEELAQLALRRPEDPVKEGQINAAIAMVHGIRPRDEVEAMLAAQMFAAHHMAMEAASRANWKSPPPKLRDMHVKHAEKLMRVFAAQVEALQRYRGKGRQKMTVEHVHVHSGGQAVVGPVSTGPEGGSEGVRAGSEGTTP